MADSYLPRAQSAKLKQGMAITALVLGVLGLPTAGCLGVGGLLGLILGIVALVRANGSPNEYGGKGLAIGGIVTSGLSLVVSPFMIGIIAAIAIPSLLRARVAANETGAIGDLRTFISAQAAYQSMSGSYGPPECLATPVTCNPDYKGSPFLVGQLASLGPKQGYRRMFIPGPAIGGGFESFALVLEPVQQGQTGVRAFCGDSSGIICSTSDGSTPPVLDGGCDVSAACSPIR